MKYEDHQPLNRQSKIFAREGGASQTAQTNSSSFTRLVCPHCGHLRNTNALVKLPGPGTPAARSEASTAGLGVATQKGREVGRRTDARARLAAWAVADRGGTDVAIQRHETVLETI
jgi:hypothetical protein